MEIALSIWQCQRGQGASFVVIHFAVSCNFLLLFVCFVQVPHSVRVIESRWDEMYPLQRVARRSLCYKNSTL